MRRQFLRMLAAAVIGTGLAASANAAPPAGAAPPAAAAAPTAPPAVIQPPPAVIHAPPAVMAQPVAPHMLVPAPIPVAPVYQPAPAAGCGSTGCAASACAAEKPNLMNRFFGKHAIGVGTATPIGCSCHAADKTFMFGSCNQFFAPGKACDGGRMGYGGCGGGKCPVTGYAAPNCKPGDNCAGPYSFLNR